MWHTWVIPRIQIINTWILRITAVDFRVTVDVLRMAAVDFGVTVDVLRMASVDFGVTVDVLRIAAVDFGVTVNVPRITGTYIAGIIFFGFSCIWILVLYISGEYSSNLTCVYIMYNILWNWTATYYIHTECTGWHTDKCHNWIVTAIEATHCFHSKFLSSEGGSIKFVEGLDKLDLDNTVSSALAVVHDQH